MFRNKNDNMMELENKVDALSNMVFQMGAEIKFLKANQKENIPDDLIRYSIDRVKNTFETTVGLEKKIDLIKKKIPGIEFSLERSVADFDIIRQAFIDTPEYFDVSNDINFKSNNIDRTYYSRNLTREQLKINGAIERYMLKYKRENEDIYDIKNIMFRMESDILKKQIDLDKTNDELNKLELLSNQLFFKKVE